MQSRFERATELGTGDRPGSMAREERYEVITKARKGENTKRREKEGRDGATARQRPRVFWFRAFVFS
jgi:hypothetical protein